MIKATKKRAAKRTDLWLGLREGGSGKTGESYELGTKPKSWNRVRGFPYGVLLHVFCVKQFESVTGFRLRPGQVVKVHVSVSRSKIYPDE